MKIEQLIEELHELYDKGYDDLEVGTTGQYGKFHPFTDIIFVTIDPKTNDRVDHNNGQTVINIY